MQALHGGKAKNDKIDAQKIAVLLRGGMLPQAYVSPAEMRAPRDLLRRRIPLMRKRAELLTHVQQTHSQYNLPEIGKKIAYKTNRPGVAERFAAPAVPKSIEVDLALLDYYDQQMRDLELAIVKTAQPHDAHTLYLLQTVPGIGTILSLVLLYEMHDLARCPRLQDFVSYCRLVKCTKESAGKRYGTAGAKMGNAYLQWAFAAAAILFLRNNPAGQKFLARLEKKHGKGKSLTVLAPKLARAVYDRLKRRVVFALDTFLQSEGRRASEPAASLGHDGCSLTTVLCHKAPRASLNAHEHIGTLPCPCALDWTLVLAPVHRAKVLDGDRVLPLPRT
jgi:transposase